MEFKFKELHKEFDKLNMRLKVILYALAGFVDHKYGKELVLTHLFRTQAEQDDIYCRLKEYQDNPWKSVHQYYRGADVRLHNFKKNEVDEIVEFLNKNFEYTGRLKTCLPHEVGNNGYHLHVQIDSDGVTNIREDDY